MNHKKSNITKEVDIEEELNNSLVNNKLYPFNITFTKGLGFNGLVSITFFIKSDLDELLNIVGYNKLCDKSGHLILNENNTIIFTGMALVNLFSKIL